MRIYTPKQAAIRYLALALGCSIAGTIGLALWNFTGIPDWMSVHLVSLSFSVPDTITVLLDLVPCFRTTIFFVLPYYLILLLPVLFALRTQSGLKRSTLVGLQVFLCLLHVVASLHYSMSVFEKSVPVDANSRVDVHIERESN